MKIDSIEQLYQQKFHIIFKHLISLGCSKENAEDIVHNTFYKAIENMIHLEEKKHFRLVIQSFDSSIL